VTDSTVKDVLVVEDSQADIYLIQRAVADYRPDIRLWLVTNGRDALTFLRREGPYVHAPIPGLIILDINLPHVHGTEVLAELRALPAFETTPVVMFTSARKDLEEEHCLQLGANAYVQKPFELEAFFAAIRDIVSKWLSPSSP
jgi:two-component system, chemotaxis family, response regulator Rcp1